MPDSGLDVAASGRRLGVLVVGLGGAVATTAAAGIEMLRAGSNDMAGLPLAGVGAPGIAAYRNLHFAGWDLHGEDLNEAVREHRVLDREQAEIVGPTLGQDEALARRRQPRLLQERRRRQQGGGEVAPRRGQQDPRGHPPASRDHGDRSSGDDQPRLRRALAGPRRGGAAHARQFRARPGQQRPGHQPGHALRLRRDRRGRAVRQLHAEPGRRRSGADGDGRAAQRPGRRQGRQDRADLPQDGAGAGVPLAVAVRRGLVQHQHPRQPRRPGAGQPGQPAEQAEHQGLGARRHPRLPGRGPRRRHPLLQAARRQQGGLGQRSIWSASWARRCRSR